MAELITLDEAKDYGKVRGSESDDLLNAIIPAVSASIRQWTGFDWDLRAYTERRNGNGLGQTTALRAGPPGPPVLAAPAPTATEDGLALTVATSYSVTADVIVDLERGAFHRRVGRWEPGIQNVVLGYSAGDAVASIPGDVKLVARYATIMLWRASDRKTVGIASRGGDKGNVGLLEDLPALYKRMLDARRRWNQPAA